MILLIKFLNILLPILYLGLVVFYFIYFNRTQRWVVPYMENSLKLTIVTHFLHICLWTIYFQRIPLANILEVFSVLAFLLTTIYFYIEYRNKIKTTGPFILAVTFLLQLISSSFIGYSRQMPEILKSQMFVLHTSAVMIGYAALFISAIYGVMYLLLFYKIKNAHFGIIYGRLPSLEELNEMNYRAAILGFAFMTITIFLGLIWRKAEFPGLPHFDPKVISAYSVWVVYGMVVFGKKIGGWSGKRLAYLSIGGFIIILFSIIVVTLFLNTFHRFV